MPQRIVSFQNVQKLKGTRPERYAFLLSREQSCARCQPRGRAGCPLAQMMVSPACQCHMRSAVADGSSSSSLLPCPSLHSSPTRYCSSPRILATAHATGRSTDHTTTSRHYVITPACTVWFPVDDGCWKKRPCSRDREPRAAAQRQQQTAGDGAC